MEKEEFQVVISALKREIIDLQNKSEGINIRLVEVQNILNILLFQIEENTNKSLIDIKRLAIWQLN